MLPHISAFHTANSSCWSIPAPWKADTALVPSQIPHFCPFPVTAAEENSRLGGNEALEPFQRTLDCFPSQESFPRSRLSPGAVSCFTFLLTPSCPPIPHSQGMNAKDGAWAALPPPLLHSPKLILGSIWEIKNARGHPGLVLLGRTPRLGAGSARE